MDHAPNPDHEAIAEAVDAVCAGFDDDYTNGIQVSYMSGPDLVPDWVHEAFESGAAVVAASKDQPVFIMTTASSRHAGGVNMLMCDSSCHFVSDSIGLEAWRALGSRNGGELAAGDVLRIETPGGGGYGTS